MLVSRVLVGVACIPPLVYLLLWHRGAYTVPVVMTVAALAMLNEFMGLARKAGHKPAVILSMLLGLGLCLVRYPWGSEAWTLPVLVVGLIVILSAHVVRAGKPLKVDDAASSVLGVILVPFCFSYLILLHAMGEDGGAVVFLLFVLTWASDSAAYFVGKTLGQHKLASLVSPNKTVEGAVAAVGGALLAAMVLRLTWRAFPLSLPHCLVAALFVSTVGQFGDLTISLLKRQAGVKDSATWIPGHGGLLDLFDSLLLTGPVLYYYLQHCCSGS